MNEWINKLFMRKPRILGSIANWMGTEYWLGLGYLWKYEWMMQMIQTIRSLLSQSHYGTLNDNIKT